MCAVGYLVLSCRVLRRLLILFSAPDVQFYTARSLTHSSIYLSMHPGLSSGLASLSQHNVIIGNNKSTNSARHTKEQ